MISGSSTLRRKNGPGCLAAVPLPAGRTLTAGNCAINGDNGIYGTLRVRAPGNVPGSRDGEVGWTDKNGNLGFLAEKDSILPSEATSYLLTTYGSIKSTKVCYGSNLQREPCLCVEPDHFDGIRYRQWRYATEQSRVLDGRASIGTGILNSSGSATLSVNNLTVGSHILTASYAGDGNNFAVNAPLTETVEDFSIAAGATTTATIKSGSSATYTFTLNPLAPATTFPSALTLSASGGPAGSTYTLSPTTITSGEVPHPSLLPSLLHRSQIPRSRRPRDPALLDHFRLS